MQRIYVAEYYTDTMEGRGTALAKQYFVDPEDARRHAKSLPGVMGAPNNLPIKEFVLYDTFTEYMDVESGKRVNDMLSRFTQDEIFLLEKHFSQQKK